MGQSTLDHVLHSAGIADVRQLTKAHVSKWRTTRLASVKPKTVEKDLALLKAILNVAVKDGLMQENPAMVAMPALKDAGRHDADDGGRSGFSEPELVAIFGSEIWASGARFAGGKGEAQHWLPILGLFTGARLDELAHLRIADVFRVDEHNCSVLRTRDGRGDKLAGGCIPVHPSLEALGFLDYANHVKKLGGIWLFPELPDKWSEVRTRSSGWEAWWGRYKKSIGQRDALYHRFRHTFTDLARRNRMAEVHCRAITGHRQGNGVDAHDRYGTDGAGFAPLRDDYFERFVVPQSVLQLMPRWTHELAKPVLRRKRGKRAKAA
jgi:integrase